MIKMYNYMNYEHELITLGHTENPTLIHAIKKWRRLISSDRNRYSISDSDRDACEGSLGEVRDWWDFWDGWTKLLVKYIVIENCWGLRPCVQGRY